MIYLVKKKTAIQERTELLYLLTVFRKLVGKVSPTWWSSYVLLARIEFSGNLPISAIFCMLQELAVDQLMLRFVVINFQGWVYNLQRCSTHVIELNGFCNSNIINMCVLWDAAYNLCTYLWWENYVDITCWVPNGNKSPTIGIIAGVLYSRIKVRLRAFQMHTICWQKTLLLTFLPCLSLCWLLLSNVNNLHAAINNSKTNKSELMECIILKKGEVF